MKLSILAVAVTLSSSMMAQSVQTGPSTVVHSSGAFASMLGFTGNGSVFIYATHTDRPQLATFVNFDIFIFNPDGTVSDTYGSGTVAEDDLTGNKTKLTLHVNTSPSSFNTKTCRSGGVCEPGPFGLIQIDFTADGVFSGHLISEDQREFFQASERAHYDANYAHALANGSILGVSVINGVGDLGVNRGTTITLTRKAATLPQ
jgi:hypothetical protein